ncbi:ATP-binding cassette sub-family A member 2-like isoform X2 [Bolinopsis microptera]|uniref:ATP-binding cassette sub-family A member 2-like isoform X2 n=1 Tax=Bolinopsis microptera TaxID=2820187 RepID=UPI0030799CF2
MTNRFFQQLKVLLWKNYKLKTRRPVLFVIEIFIPIVLCFILGQVRRTKPPSVMTSSYHYATGMPSAGLIPFIQGLPVVGCWDYEHFNVEYYPFPKWFQELPNIEKAFRKVAAWPLVHNETMRTAFQEFAMNNLSLSNKEATALTVSTVNLTSAFSSDIFDVDGVTSELGESNTGDLLLYIIDSDIDSIFGLILNARACKGTLESMMDFPQKVPHKLTTEEMANVNKAICDMGPTEEITFNYFTKPDQTEIQSEVATLTSLVKQSFYPIPIGASAPVIEIYQRSLKLEYRALRTTLALIKYYICPTLKNDMDKFFINLEKDMDLYEAEKQDYQTTPPLYPPEDPDVKLQSPLQPHRRSADQNIFNHNKGEHPNQYLTKREITDRQGDSSVNEMNPLSEKHSSRNVKKSLESNPNEISVIESEIWYTLTQGRIYYSPKTPLVEDIISHANATFKKMADLVNGTSNLEKKIENLMVEMDDPAKSMFITTGINALIKYMGLPPTDNATAVLEDVSNVLKQLITLPESFSLDRFTGFDTEREMELAGVAAEKSNDTWLWAGVTFEDLADNITELPDNIRYKIRMKTGYMPPLQNIRYTYWRSYPYDYLWDRQYWVFGFVYIQDFIERGISDFIGNGTFNLPGSYSQMFPYPCWLNDKYLFIISRTLPMCMVISWVYIIAMSTKRIVYEKELRLKEVMRVMGLGDAVHWWGWGITLLVTSSVTNVFLVLILKHGQITIFSDWFLIYILLSMFSLCNIAMCFLISVFFVQSKLAAVVSAVAFYTSYLPYTIASLQEENMDFWMKMLASGSSTTAFGFGMLQIARFEEQGIGLQWDNFYYPPDNAQEFSTLHVFGMMAFDFVFYILLTFYFQQVLPSNHGFISKPWYYPIKGCLKPIVRWLENAGALRQGYMEVPDEVDFVELERCVSTEDTELDCCEIEPVGKHLIPGVEMVALSKHYGGKHNPYALRNLSLKLYQGQVTALLGHNGAGKTTTMSILTGMIGPTSGHYDIRYASEEALDCRDTVGVCPQHNVLWDELTIAEHLLFYGQLRGMSYDKINREMEKFICEVDLPLEKRNCESKILSGGMKRKLSVAIAFLGSTKTLILDEPTAGVDPKARRDIWDMIVKNKRDRTILLSTHHMEEADVLGDRIAILSQGNLICCGSSLFLKRLSGGTYFLTVEINVGTPPETLVKIVEEIFSSVFIRSSSSNQIVMELEASDMDLFEKLCICLDEMKKANEIASYGISAPTMEEVFLKLSSSSHHDTKWQDNNIRLASKGVGDVTDHGDNDVTLNGGDVMTNGDTRNGRLDTIFEDNSTSATNLDKNGNKDENSVHFNQKADTSSDDSPVDLTETDEPGSTDFTYRQMPSFGSSKSPLVTGGGDGIYNTGYRLYWQQFTSLFIKRWHHGKRDKKGVFAQVVLPALFIAAAMSINVAVPMNSNYKPRVLSFSMFQTPNYIPFEMRTPDTNVTPFNSSLLREFGVTYGDYFLREVPAAPREISFESSDTYPSRVYESGGEWKAERDFVPQYPTCDVRYRINNWSGPVPFPTGGFETASGDILANVTGNNLTNYLLITQPEYKLSRYTALTFDDKRSDIIPEYDSAYSAKRNIVKTWYLNKGYHAMPTALNAMNNLQLKNAGSKHHITVAAQAMNNTATKTSHEYIQQGVPIVISIFIIVGLSFVPTSFVVYLVAERSSNAKHLQFCAGVGAEVYWISNYVWDMFNFLLPTSVSIIVFYAFQQEAFVNEIGAVVVLIMLYGLAATPMFYPASFIFKIPSAAYVTLLCSNLFVAVTTSYSVFTLERFPEDETLTMYANVLDVAFLVFPPYCLGKGFVDLTYKYVMTVIYESMGIKANGKLVENAWGWRCLGRYICVLPLTAVFWLCVTIAIEKYTLRKRRVIRTLDSDDSEVNNDVHLEQLRAKESKDDILNVNGLTKRYKTYSVQYFRDLLRRRPTAKHSNVAVKNVSFGVKKGECFGLLGINGAGKTSTFNMLTGALSVTAGDASVGGYSVVTNLHKVQQLLGYCPQFDALIDSLTGREMLTLFAGLHGVKNPTNSADSYIKQLGIQKYSNMQCHKYSGGNRRKLSAAIALVGSPEVLLLDEPTAGMDPGARRQLWGVIRAAKRVGTSILLTSHSMGECEVLCDRIGIMCKGRLQCVGTPHYLKQKYGSGYTATIKTGNVGVLIARLEEELTTPTLLEHHHNMVIYSIPQHSSLAPLFSVLSRLRKEDVCEDYSISQCSLEDVFINFARDSELSRDDDDDDDIKAQLSPQIQTKTPNNYLRNDFKVL